MFHIHKEYDNTYSVYDDESYIIRSFNNKCDAQNWINFNIPRPRQKTKQEIVREDREKKLKRILK